MNGHEHDIGFTDGVSAALGSTRVLRLALNVLYDGIDELCDQAARFGTEVGPLLNA